MFGPNVEEKNLQNLNYIKCFFIYIPFPTLSSIFTLKNI